MSRRILAMTAAALFAACSAQSALSQAAKPASRAAPEAASALEPKPLVHARKWMIVAANPLAAEAGRRILRQGGSAVDAAIAAQLVLNVVEPQSSGIGGGGFALHWNAAQKTLAAWDGRETAPAAAQPDLFLDAEGEPLSFIPAATSGLAVGAPGLPRLLEQLHRTGGRLAWPLLFEDAIALAEQGFAVSPRLHASIKFMAPRLRGNPEIRALFFDAEGAPLAIGSRLRQPALAGSLRALARAGAEAAYRGPLAETIVRAVAAQPRPGALSVSDLGAYRAVRRDPVCMLYRKRYRICGMPPPSSGGVTSLQLLGLLERATPPEAGAEGRAHVFLEASRLAYADRDRYLADPDHVSQPVEGLLASAYLAERAALIDWTKAGAIPARPGTPKGAPGAAASGDGRDKPGTTHLTVIDGEGDIVSLTSSIEIAFGAARMAGGFLLNNQLTDFSFAPEKNGEPIANAPGPGKRPRSSMAPSIVFDASSGEPLFALGSPGGSRIIEYVAYALSGLIDEGLSPSEAAARPHLSHRNRAATLEDRREADALAPGLSAKGHALSRDKMVSGLAIIAIKPTGLLLGGADPRREGAALGD